MISSANNATIRRTRRLRKRAERVKRRAFLVEGHRAVRVAVETDSGVELLLHTPAAAKRHRQLIIDAEDAGTRVLEVTPHIMATLTAAATTPDVVAVVRIPLPAAAASGPTLIMAGVRDPATVGALLSTAASAGMTRAVAVKGTADIYSSAPVRIGAGAHFLIGLLQSPSLEDCLATAKAERVVRLGTQGPPPWSVDLSGSIALIVDDDDDADGDVAVPGEAGARAPLAIRAAVTMFEARRQREAG
ncbi:MAG: TrmH family RNA methyltransferase [Actinomycetota bacterium]|nr:RNA methyltransferase [Actinomycetota bacterium]